MTADLERFLRGRRCNHDWYIEEHGHFKDTFFTCRCGECGHRVEISRIEATNCRTEKKFIEYVKNKLGSLETGDVRRLGLSVPAILPTFAGQRDGATI